MINNIRDAFIDMLRSSTWMDEDSKEKAIEKVNLKKNNFEIFNKYFPRRYQSMKKLVIQNI
jgi:predicted metalloendopeptidase